MSLSWGDLGILKAAGNKPAAEAAARSHWSLSAVCVPLPVLQCDSLETVPLPPAHISPLRTDQCCHSCDRQTQPRVRNLSICATALSPRHCSIIPRSSVSPVACSCRRDICLIYGGTRLDLGFHSQTECGEGTQHGSRLA